MLKDKLKDLLKENWNKEISCDSLEDSEISELVQMYKINNSLDRTQKCQQISQVLQEKKRLHVLKKKMRFSLQHNGCKSTIESMNPQELELLQKLYNTTSKDKLCNVLDSMLIKKLPSEIMSNIFLFSDSNDINKWKETGMIDSYTFNRKKDKNIEEAAANGNITGIKYLLGTPSRSGSGSGSLSRELDSIDEETLRIILEKGIANGHMNVLKYVTENSSFTKTGILKLAAADNQMEMVEYICVNLNPSFNDIDNAVIASIDNKNNTMIKYLLDKFMESDAPDKVDLLGYVATYGISEGNVDFVKYIISLTRDLDYDNLLGNSARYGNLELVKYFASLGASVIAPFSLQEAARYGHLDVVKFLVENGNPIRSDIVVSSVTNNHLQLFKYLADQNQYEPYWYVYLDITIQKNRFDMLKYLVEVKGVKPSVIQLISSLDNPAIEVEILKYLSKLLGEPLEEIKIFEEIENGTLTTKIDDPQMLKKAIERSIVHDKVDVFKALVDDISEENITFAARFNSLSIMKYIVSKGIQIPISAPSVAQLFRHTEMFSYLSDVFLELYDRNLEQEMPWF